MRSIMLFELQGIFPSAIKSLEVYYTLKGIKPCARLLCSDDSLSETLNFLKNNNINYSISDFKVIKQSTIAGFYSDKSAKITKDDERKGHFILYLSKNKKTADNAKYSEEKQAHRELGIILGYPECCCDFFERNFSENQTDLTLQCLKNSDGFEFDFHSNICARHFDISLLSHFPCSFNCDESIKTAKNNFGIVKRYFPHISASFERHLKSVAVYTKNQGVFLLADFRKNKNEIIFDKLIGTEKNKLYYFLGSSKKIELLDKNTALVNGETLQDDFGFMVFYWNERIS